MHILSRLIQQYPNLGYLSSRIKIHHVDKSIYSTKQKKLQALLRKIRIEFGLNQAELARKLGKPQSFVSKYESGERRLDLIEIRKICETMEITLKEFVERFEDSL